MSEGQMGRVSFGPVGGEPLGLTGKDIVWGTPDGAGPGLDLTRFVKSLELKPQARYPRVKKGDRVQFVRDGEASDWIVADVDDDGNGTLEPAP